jgi:hypothetical protein
VANAWYQRKKQRDGGRASQAAVALMRKLAKALFHVGHGAVFDSTKLFDIRRLHLAAAKSPTGDLPLQRISAPCKSVVCLEAP